MELEDARAAPMDLYGRVKANSEFHYITPADARTVAIVRVYALYGSRSITIWFDENDDDQLCIAMTPNMRRQYETALAALRREADEKPEAATDAKDNIPVPPQ